MAKAIKYAEKVAVYAAKGAWAVYERLNRISPNPSFTPKWSEKPLLKSWEKEKPPLGWPRTTDSLCPKCVPEIRKQILDGKLPHEAPPCQCLFAVCSPGRLNREHSGSVSRQLAGQRNSVGIVIFLTLAVTASLGRFGRSGRCRRKCCRPRSPASASAMEPVTSKVRSGRIFLDSHAS